MTNSVRFVMEHLVADGKLDVAKALLRRAIEAAKTKDLGVLSYDFFLNGGESTIYVVEWYRDSEAVLAHLGTVADILPKLLDVAQVTRFEVFGNPSEALVQDLAPLGPRVVTHWDGFTR
jgi:quinol monooxygenase YgiN